MTTFSRTEALIPAVDGIQMTAYRRQRAINKVKGTTYEMDVARLEGVDISAGGEAMTPYDIIDLWKQEDILVYRSRSIGGKIEDSGGAIKAVPGGIGQELSEYRILVMDYQNDIKEILGLNAVTDATSPPQKMLNGVANFAAAGTNNALSDLSFADKKMKQDITQSVLIRIQDMVRHGRGDEIAAIIGRDSARRLGKAPALDKYHFGITIEDDPTPEEDQQFLGALIEAVKTGQITVDEQFMAQSLYKENMRKGQLYLSYRIRKNKEEAAAQKLQDIQANGQQQQQSAQVTAQLEQQTITLKADLELRNAIEIEKEKQNTIRLASEYDLEKERIGASGRVEASFVQAKGRDENNRRDVKGMLIKEGKQAQIGDIDIPADLESRVAPVTSAEHPRLPMTGFSFLSPPEQHQMQQQGPAEEMAEPQGQPEEMEMEQAA